MYNIQQLNPVCFPFDLKHYKMILTNNSQKQKNIEKSHIKDASMSKSKIKLEAPPFSTKVS